MTSSRKPLPMLMPVSKLPVTSDKFFSKTTFRAALFVAFGSAAALVQGCGDESFEDEAFGVMDLAPLYTGVTSSAAPTGGVPTTLLPTQAFANGTSSDFYDFGTVPSITQTIPAMDGAPARTIRFAPVNPIYFFFDQSGNPLVAAPQRDQRTNRWVMPGGNPTLSPNQDDNADRQIPFSLRRRQHVTDAVRGSTAHQRPIIDVGPELKGTIYTGMWEVIEVRVSAGYNPDAIKSYKTLKKALDAGKVSLNATGKVINCPLVDERTAITPSLANWEDPVPRIDLWYRRKLGFCLLVNGWQTLAREGQLIKAGDNDARLSTFDTDEVTVAGQGQSQTKLVVPIRDIVIPVLPGKTPFETITQPALVSGVPRRTDQDPTGYSPLGVNVSVQVPMGSPAPVSVDQVDAAWVRVPANPVVVRNFAYIGPLPTCGAKVDNMMGGTKCMVDPAMPCPGGLECNADTCLCDVPSVGYGEVCAAGFQRCRAKPLAGEKDFAPLGFVCHPRPRGFCVPRCDASPPNPMMPDRVTNADCAGLPGFTCVTGRDGTRTDAANQSVCARSCQPTDREDSSRAVCTEPHEVSLPTADGSGVETIDIAARLRCFAQRGIEACNFDDSLEPR